MRLTKNLIHVCLMKILTMFEILRRYAPQDDICLIKRHWGCAKGADIYLSIYTVIILN